MKKIAFGLALLLIFGAVCCVAEEDAATSLPPIEGGKLSVDESQVTEAPVTVETGGVLEMEQDGVLMRIIIPEENVDADTVFTIAPVTETPLLDETEIVKGFEIRRQGSDEEHVALNDYACIQFLLDEDPGDDFTIVRYGETFADCEAVYTTKRRMGDKWVVMAAVDGFSTFGMSRKEYYEKYGKRWQPDKELVTMIISFDEIVWTKQGTVDIAVHLRMKMYFDEAYIELPANIPDPGYDDNYAYHGSARVRIYTLTDAQGRGWYSDFANDSLEILWSGYEIGGLSIKHGMLPLKNLSNRSYDPELGQFPYKEGTMIDFPYDITILSPSGNSGVEMTLRPFNAFSATFITGTYVEVPQNSKAARNAGKPVKPLVDTKGAMPSKAYEDAPAQSDQPADAQQDASQDQAQPPAAQEPVDLAETLAELERQYEELKDKLPPEQLEMMEQAIEALRKQVK